MNKDEKKRKVPRGKWSVIIKGNREPKNMPIRESKQKKNKSKQEKNNG
jgi:hypothetical protein